MSQQVFGVVGAVAGFFVGGVAGAVAGYAIGSGALLPKAKGLEGPSLSDLKVTGSSYGTPIPWLRGAPRVSGSLWWASEKRKISSTSSGGKGSGPKVTTSTYEVDVMVGLCENEIAAITRIWSNGKLVYTKRSEADSGSLGASEATDLWRRFTFYPGSATQLPDPTYEAAVGTANAPAYRGRAYAFFEGLQLGSDGQIPNLTFEVAQVATEAAGQRIVGVAATGGAVFADIATQPDSSAPAPAIVAMFPETRIAVTTTGSTVVHRYETATGAYLGTSTRTGAAEAYPGEINFFAPSTPSYPVGVLQGQPIRAQKQGTAFGTGGAYIVTAGVASGSPAPSSGYDFTTVLPAGRFLGSVTLCSNGQHILITSAPSDATGGGSVIDRWDLLSYNGSVATIVRTGTFPASITSSVFGFGNVAALSYTQTASMLSNDLTTVWAAIGSGTRSVYKYQIGADDVLRQVQVFNQTPDGVGIIDANAYPGIWAQDGLCVVVAKDCYMLFGSNSYDVGTATIRATVEALCARAGMPAGTYDASALAGITKPVRALAVADVSATRGTLEQLAAAYFFDCTLADKLYFRPRGGSPVVTIPFEDLGAGAERAAAEPLALVYGSDLELPPQVFVSYINVSDDNQAGSEGSSRIVASQAAAKTVQLALGFTPSEAKGIADALVVDGLSGLVTSNIALPLNYSRLEPGDVVNVLDEASTSYRVRLLRRNEAGGVLSFEVAVDDASAFTSSQITSGGYTPSNTVGGTSATLLQLLDIPLLRDADDGPGYYVAAKGAASGWPGAAVQSSLNNTDFDQVAEVGELAIFGTCTTTLGNYTGVGFDEVNSVTVNVGTGELASSTRDAMLADVSINAMLIGSEVIRFRTATGSAGAYVLTGLLRGQRGTEWAIGTHAASERCVLLQARGMRRVTTQTSDTGQVRYVKGVTLGALASSATASSFTNTGIGQKPLSPVNLRVLQTAAGYLATWSRRTRLSASFVGAAGAKVPLGEAAEAYDVELLTSGDALVSTQRATSQSAALSVASVVFSLPAPTIKTALIGGHYYGVEYGGNTNTSLRRLVRQTTAGISAQSPYLGNAMIDAVYTATDAYTAAYYTTATVPAGFAGTFLQRFALSDITAAAATYTAPNPGDIVGIAHDGADLWALEQFSLRLRKLNASTLAVTSSQAFTGPIQGGLASASGKLFLIDGGALVCWDTAGASETWRVPLPAGHNSSRGIVAQGSNVFVSSYPLGVLVYSQAAGTLVATTGLLDYGPATAGGVTRFGSDVAFTAGKSATVLNGSTGAVSVTFEVAGSPVAGADSTNLLVLGQSSLALVGADITQAYQPLGGSLSGYKVRVSQVSALAGRGYSTTTVIT